MRGYPGPKAEGVWLVVAGEADQQPLVLDVIVHERRHVRVVVENDVCAALDVTGVVLDGHWT